MGFFKKLILEALLNEGTAEINDIESALDNHYAVNINYNSPDTERVASGERIIYPIAYGLSMKGNPVIRAYQPQGDTSSKVPSWKMFRIDRIENWETTNDKYTTRDIPDLRLKHDDGMSVEYKSAFGGEDKNVKPESPDNNQYDSTPVTKQEVEKPETLQQTSNQEPYQNVNVGNEKQVSQNNLDNNQENPHIPSGINQNIPLAPENKPISLSNDVFDNTNTEPEEDNDEEEQSQEAESPEPIYNDNEENDEEKENEFLQEVRRINSLTKRINEIRRK